MFCSNCGGKIADNSRFCSHCGAPIPQAMPNITTAPSPLPIHQQNNFIGQPKGKLTNQKIVILILSALSLIFILAIPYVNVYRLSSSYPLWLIGGNDFPSFLNDDFKPALALFLMLFIAVNITIVISVLNEKRALCLAAAIAGILISFAGFSLVMGMVEEAQSSRSNIYCAPIGAILQLGLAVVMLAMIIRERRKSR